MGQFNKDSVVCFLGDSITFHGDWFRRVYEYYRLEQKIPCRMYNCGVPGDRAAHGMFRLEDTIFCYEPTDVVIAYGMNDSGCPTYRKEPLTDSAVMERRRTLDNSIYSLRHIVEKCIKRGIRVTLCTSTLVDELTESDAPIYHGSYGAFLELCLRTRAIAEETGADFIDFTFPFRDVSLKLYKEGKTIVGPDRVHPLPEGHEFLARVFLQQQGFDVAIPQTWEELHALTAVPHDAWEERRRQLEIDANCNMYMEWDFGFGRKSKEAMADAITHDQREDIHKRGEFYLATRDLIPARRQALIDFTNTVGKE